jgi:23S rRNA (uracil1939-C5)-methyltransferase
LAQLRPTLAAVDLMVLNPPRKGLQTEALTAIIGLGPPRLIYVSCEPNTLARDLDRLVAVGYRIVSAQPFDMFPQTEEVETVVLLVRHGSKE